MGVGSFSFFDKIKPKRYEIIENHHKDEDQEGNNSPEIETLPLFPIHGGSHQDFFGRKTDLSSEHSVLVTIPDELVSPRWPSFT